jgi:pimeloyl-ACP methyl ester carboxylesterase/membrane protein DedA with SNARE-associated domain
MKRLMAISDLPNTPLGKKKWIVGVVAVYAILLLISHTVRSRRSDPWPPPDALRSITLSEQPPLQGEEHHGTVIRYIDTASLEGPDRPVILLIHGNPMAASRVFPDLADRLTTAGRVLAPDLPGFGYSTRSISDYGFTSQAAYLTQYLDQLQIGQVHIAAYSMGAGAAIHMATAAPERIASITLISSIGVQELALLGDHHLNHALHSLQLGVIWAVHELTPHMGVFDRLALNPHSARNLFDADQRPLRELLGRITQPTLIIHGQSDATVPHAAAREHHRLIPHSSLKTLQGGHQVLFQQTAHIAKCITQHIDDTTAGRSRTLAQADKSRRQASRTPFGQIRLPEAGGLRLLLYTVLIGLATLISEELACIGAGMMAARGILGFMPATLAAFTGIVIGDLMLYAAGRYIGRPAIARIPFRWFIKSEEVADATRWFNDKGLWIIFTSRFLPGSRLPVYFTAGILGGHAGTLLFYFCIAAALWTPGLVGLAAWTGESVLAYYAEFNQYAVWVAAGTVIGLWILIQICIPRLGLPGRFIFKKARKKRRSAADKQHPNNATRLS